MKKATISILFVTVFILMSFFPAMADQKAWDKLYEAAKKEGELVFNTIMPDIPAYNPVVDAWNKRFPGIKLTLISTGGMQAAPRIITESSAGQISMDAARLGMNAALPLLDRDLIQKYDWTGFDINEDDIILDGKALDYIPTPWTIYYNTEFIAEADAPKTWEDLLDPKFKGKICLHRASPNIPGLVLAWGEEKWRDYVKKLATQKVVPGVRSGNVIQKVSSGEAWIGNGGLHMVLPAKKKGAPLGVTTISPQGNTDTYLWSFKGCPHPNAAKLFMAWSMTPDGKKALDLTGYAFDANKRQIIQSKGIKVVPIENIEKARLSARMAKEFPKIMGFVAR